MAIVDGLRDQGKRVVNGLLSWSGLRLVSSRWGPRGFTDALHRVRARGICPEQIVDVGADRGLWTEDCLMVFPEADYFLVEPLSENEPFLAEIGRTRNHVDYYVGALGAEPGRLALYAHRDQSSFLPSEYANAADCTTRDVEVRTLDSFLEEGRIRPPDLIKADVQGFELQVLKGAKHCLESTELLLLEVSYQQIYEGSPLAHEVISFVGELGFAIYDICTYSQRPLDGELAQSDILFAKAESVLFSKKGWARVR